MSATPVASNSNSETKQCRICLAGTEEEATCGKLLKPCLCKGSMQFVHVKCLNQWRMSSGSRSAFYKCNTCQYSYAFARTRAVGLATSPMVLGLSSAVLFMTLSFLASFVVVFFFPSLATPSANPMKARSIGDTFVSPLTVANGIIGYALRTYQYFSPWSIWSWGYDDAWEDSDLEDIPTEPVDLRSMGLLEWLLHRFLLGLSAIGSFSFVSLLWQTNLLNLVGFRRGFRGRNNRRETASNVTAIIILIFIVIGIARAIRNVYRFNRSMAERMLARIEDVILEVN